MTVTWRGISPTSYIYDEFQYDTSGLKIPEPPVPIMAEINDMILRFQNERRRNLGPSPEEVARAMEERLEKTEAQQRLQDSLKQAILSDFGITEKQVAVVARTYQQRKKRRKKAQ